MNSNININLDIDEIYSRNELYWGKEFQKSLWDKHIIIFGLGGVGGYAVDALARSGIGNFTLIDFDYVATSNINRQLIAAIPNIGKAKTELMMERVQSINPHIRVNIIKDFYTSELNGIFETQKVDFVVDAIDTLKYKIDLIDFCIKNNIPIISSMGAGNRIDPSKLYVSDISEIKTGKCPFIKNVLSKLKSTGVTKGLTVVTSSEKPHSLVKFENTEEIRTCSGETIIMKKFTPASTPFVPPVAGYLMASYIVRKFFNTSV